jgi:hypothetical protein
LNPDLIFFLFFSGDGDSFKSVDFSNQFFSNEIFDFDGVVSVDDIGLDGEMGISVSHFEFVSLGDSSDHISDVGGDGGDGAFLFSGSEPHCNYYFLYFGRKLWRLFRFSS